MSFSAAKKVKCFLGLIIIFVPHNFRQLLQPAIVLLSGPAQKQPTRPRGQLYSPPLHCPSWSESTDKFSFCFNPRKHFTFFAPESAILGVENDKKSEVLFIQFLCFMKGKLKINGFFWKKSSSYSSNQIDFGGGFHFLQRQQIVVCMENKVKN